MNIELQPIRDVIEQANPTRHEITAVTLNELLSMELPPREYLLEPWLPKSGLCMVYAKRGVGKTFFALEVAMAVAYGKQFLSFKAPKSASVLYIDGEMPANSMQERLRNIKKRMPNTGDYIEPRFITPDLLDVSTPDLSTYHGQNSIAPLLEQADLIIVDNISTLSAGKENEAESWIPLQTWALRLRKQGKSVLFIHHAGKNGAQRGTSKREDTLDTVIALKHAADYEPSMGACFELHFEKTRGIMGDCVRPLLCQLTDEGWTSQTLQFETSHDRVMELFCKGIRQIDIVKETGLSKSQVSKIISKSKIM
ncbi:AAA family ATPase [Fluoribacter gormanii]|uniref:AAA family ATPase n=1 Tax=Fluoribacter gormanii TaxID=464 RepID=UPI002244B10A|nr:AAA family ATPase [Fluoribacter gormanii]MCW8470648.1 AAA family ATPase [Fluoribacter gormanii]